jgi:uncharacterized protein (DUF885 family)
MTQDIYSLSDQLVDEFIAAVPAFATYLGIPGYDHLWNDYSPEGWDRLADLARNQLGRIAALDRSDDPWAVLASDVAEAEIRRRLADYEVGEHLRDLNSIASALQDLRDTFDQMDTSTAQGWENVASRLERLPDAVAGYIRSLDEGRARGLAVAKRQVVEAARQARNHAGDKSHFSTYPMAFDGSGVGDAALRSRVEAGIDTARSAFATLADYLEQRYLPEAVDRDAVGPDRYRHLARRFLGADIDPVETYHWGWSEVERLRQRMATVCDQILPGADLATTLNLLLTDPARAAASQAEFVDLMQERQEIALRELEGVHFDVPEPIRAIQVKMTPPGGSLGAYYYNPSEDFVRPGTVFWSKGDQQQIPLFDEVSTAYHEGFPGHHLQVGLQLTAGDRFSRFQKLLVWYSGSGEGWALYAEDLMEELGYLEKPDYVMGKLAGEMLRACRVVIDIGSHLEMDIPGGQPFHPGEKWTFETGVEMLRSYAAQDSAIAVSEMNRYLGWPGQAISYKLGARAIHDLRATEQARLGASYDQKAFHARLLEVGAVGLDTLRAHMRPS